MDIKTIRRFADAVPVPDDHQEWLKQRSKGIGGSDAGAIMGLNPYKSRWTLWAEKTGMLPSDVPDNEAMRTGRDLEQYVAERFTEETGLKVKKSSFSFQSKDYPFMLANIDRMVVGENAGLECKTVNALSHTDFEGGDIQPSYYAQCAHYMAVTGADHWYIAILKLGKGFYWFRIDRDEEEIKSLIEAEQAFWELVKTGTAPAVDSSDSTADTLAFLHKDSDGPALDLTAWHSQLDKYEELKGLIADLTKERKAIGNQLKSCMTDTSIAYAENYKITYKCPKPRTVLDEEKLSRLYPEAYKDCLTTKAGAPRLLVTDTAKKKGRKDYDITNG